MDGNERTSWGVAEVLRIHSGLSIRPRRDDCLILAGDITFNCQAVGFHAVADTFEVELLVPSSFPRELPAAWELEGRIPATYHKMSDGSLCLGSPIRQRMAVGLRPTLGHFIERCVVTYLYGFAHHERHGVQPFGELKHGDVGVVEELKALFGIKDPHACLEMVRLAGLDRRKANQHPCPCSSGLRLGKCHHQCVNKLRERCGCQCFREEYERLTKPNRGGSPCVSSS